MTVSPPLWLVLRGVFQPYLHTGCSQPTTATTAHENKHIKVARCLWSVSPGWLLQLGCKTSQVSEWHLKTDPELSQTNFFSTPAPTEVTRLCRKCDRTSNCSFHTRSLKNHRPSLSGASTNHAVIADGSLSLKGAGPALFEAGFGLLKHKNKSLWQLVSSSMAAVAARRSLTVPDLHRALVTSLFQPGEMEFDSGCSCPESSGGCIKKASQQCWQEYIYWDCLSFQEAAGGGAGCHRSPRPAGWQAIWSPISPALDGPRTGLALQTEPRITEEPRDQTGAAFYYF